MVTHRCPNLCSGGKVKQLTGDQAFYDLVPCPMCKGRGEIELPADVTPEAAFKRWEAQS